MFSLNSPLPWDGMQNISFIMDGVVSGGGLEVKGKGKKGRERVMQKSHNYNPPLFI